MMKPILFNIEMVCAILDGRKTVTRRVVRPQPNGTFDQHWGGFYKDNEWILLKEPCRPGDILYVRETWRPHSAWSGSYSSGCEIEYKAGGENLIIDGSVIAVPERETPWRPSIHMPREAARIWLRVTDVRVERLQDMDDNDVQREGFANPGDFIRLWDRTVKPADRERYGWAANPWVWVIEFERCEKPEEVHRCWNLQ